MSRRRRVACLLFVAASVLPASRAESLKPVDSLAINTRSRHRRQLKQRRDGFDPSPMAIHRGGGKAAEAAPPRAPASKTAFDDTSPIAIHRGGGKATEAPAPSDRASKSVLQAMRLLYLTYYGSLGALMPYLPVYFHSLGHPGSSIGLLGAVKPLTTFLVAPLWGILSDQSDNHVWTLQFTFLTSLAFQLLVGMNSSFRYLVVTVFAAAVLNAPVKSLIDSIVMSKLTSEEDKNQFGRMRLWGQLGFGVGSSFVGYLLSAFPADSAEPASPSAPSVVAPTSGSAMEEVVHNLEVGIELMAETAADTDALDKTARRAMVDMAWDLLGRRRSPKGYEWAFVTHAILSIPTFFCIRAFRPEKGEPAVEGKKKKNPEAEGKSAGGIKAGLSVLAKNKDALVFFFLVLVIGTSSGCIENFAYVRVREVGGTGNNMGILRLVSSLAGAPMFWFSGPVTQALGTDVVLVCAMLAYVLRFFNYAWMKHPYHALPAEALRGITFALFWSAGTLYAHTLSDFKATNLLLMNAMYGGLGQSVGAILGGKLQTKIGTAETFVYSGQTLLCFVVALVAYLATGKERAFAVPSIQP
ncbi:hypothetical protein ACHAXT_009908 [Thalassiosira profunda]